MSVIQDHVNSINATQDHEFHFHLGMIIGDNENPSQKDIGLHRNVFNERLTRINRTHWVLYWCDCERESEGSVLLTPPDC